MERTDRVMRQGESLYVTGEFDEDFDDFGFEGNESVLEDSCININFGFDDFDDFEIENQIDVSLKQEEEIETEDDLKYKKLKEEIGSLGYHLAEDIDYEQLLWFKSRERKINRSSLSVFCNRVETDLHIIFDKLQNSKATLAPQMSLFSDNEQERMQINAGNSNLDVRFIIQVRNCVMELYLKKQDVSAKEVFDEMVLEQKYDSSYLISHPKQAMRHLEAIVPATIASFKSILSKRKKGAMYRNEISNKLLRPELEEFRKLKMLVSKEKLNYIRQFSLKENAVVLKCSSCNRESRFHDIMSIIAFPTENGNFFAQVPKALSCSCGNSYVFLDSEYELLLKEFLKGERPQMDETISAAAKYAVGSAFFRLVPPLTLLETNLDYLIVSDALNNETKNSHKAESTKRIQEIAISDFDLEDAVTRFYKGLARFKKLDFQTGKESKGSLSYAQIAFFISNTLSLDYRTLKNKAIFSLLFYFSENPLLSSILDSRSIWDIENYLVLIENAGTKDIEFDKENYSNLSVIHSLLFRDEKLNPNDNVVTLLKKRKNEIEAIIERKKETRKLIIEQLLHYKDMLAFCKIINLSGFKLSDYDAIVDCPELFQLIDKVSDKMIITNYCGDYYNIWKKYGIANKTSLNQLLSKSAFEVKNLSKIKGLVKKMLEKETININRFNTCAVLVTQHSKVLADMYKAFCREDFYDFYQAVLKLPEKIELQFDESLDWLYTQMVSDIKTKFKSLKGKTKLEYQLSDFSSDELKKFRKIKNLEQLSDLALDNLIPQRLENEDINDWVSRYLKYKNENSSAPQYNNLKNDFYKIKQYFAFIAVLPLLSNFDFKEYTSSIFMLRLLETAVKDCSFKGALNIINLSEQQYKLLVDMMYTFDIGKFEWKEPRMSYRVLNGIYYSYVRPHVEHYLNKYTSMILHTSSPIENKNNLFSIRKIIADLSAVEETALSEEQEGFFGDSNTVALELSSFSGEKL